MAEGVRVAKPGRKRPLRWGRSRWKKSDMDLKEMMRTGVNFWPRIKTNEFRKGWGISWLSGWLPPFAEGLCYRELITLAFVHLDLYQTGQWTTGLNTWIYCVRMSEGKCNGGLVCSSLIHYTSACHLYARPSTCNAGLELSMRKQKNLLLNWTERFQWRQRTAASSKEGRDATVKKEVTMNE